MQSNEAYKGADHLIMALPALVNGGAGMSSLWPSVAGSDLPRLKNLAGEMGVSERVHFLSAVSPEKLGAAA